MDCRITMLTYVITNDNGGFIMIKLEFADVKSQEISNILQKHICAVLTEMFDEEIVTYSFNFVQDPDRLSGDEHFGTYETKCFRGIKTKLSPQQKAISFMQPSQIVRSEQIQDTTLLHKVIYLNLAKYFQDRYRQTVNPNIKLHDPYVVNSQQSHEFSVDYNGIVRIKRIKLFPKNIRENLCDLLMEEHNTKNPHDVLPILENYEYIDRFYDTLKHCLPIHTC